MIFSSLLVLAQQIYLHEGDHDILSGEQHHHEEPKGRGKAIAAFVITAGLVIAFLLWQIL